MRIVILPWTPESAVSGPNCFYEVSVMHAICQVSNATGKAQPVDVQYSDLQLLDVLAWW